jgi:ubiquinone biosynthesis protein Coq4
MLSNTEIRNKDFYFIFHQWQQNIDYYHGVLSTASCVVVEVNTGIIR